MFPLFLIESFQLKQRGQESLLKKGKSEYLMWLFERETKKIHKSHAAPSSLGRGHKLRKLVVVTQLAGDQST